ncbi:hypothetical protein DFH07DRAFT_978839 [Mycena maculata]|uniref:Uncharacterized protein n=1 Tax=Mycena maculata TaxID=230809 RepID=A0AAD7NVF1_9AGAR|nr:hypothetical protein DFH07DRAFT_978839 [Mycena maculata]
MAETNVKISGVPESDRDIALLHQKRRHAPSPTSCRALGGPLADLRRGVGRLRVISRWTDTARSAFIVCTRGARPCPSSAQNGFGLDQYAEGGDWDSPYVSYERSSGPSSNSTWIAWRIANLYGPKHGTPISRVVNPRGHSPTSGLPLVAFQAIRSEGEGERQNRTPIWKGGGSGYMVKHASKPQTLGYARASIVDSPAGLLAWVYEKLVGWTDRRVSLDDEAQNSTTTSPRMGVDFVVLPAPLRIYLEVGLGNPETLKNSFMTVEPPSIRMGISRFPKEIVWSKLCAGKIVFDRRHESGDTRNIIGDWETSQTRIPATYFQLSQELLLHLSLEFWEGIGPRRLVHTKFQPKVVVGSQVTTHAAPAEELRSPFSCSATTVVIQGLPIFCLLATSWAHSSRTTPRFNPG